MNAMAVEGWGKLTIAYTVYIFIEIEEFIMVAKSSTAKKRTSDETSTLIATQMRFDKLGLAKIDRAAALQGSTRSEFVRRSAVVEAEKVLLDQAYFGLDRKSFDFFSELLDKPASGKEYERLMAVKPPWDAKL
jgi:uncharacterized protein (DUF1778 family)